MKNGVVVLALQFADCIVEVYRYNEGPFTFSIFYVGGRETYNYEGFGVESVILRAALMKLAKDSLQKSITVKP